MSPNTSEQFVLSRFFRESFLPCQEPEIVTHLRKSSISAPAQEKVGLSGDISVIPLNRGYFLCTRDVILTVDTIAALHQLDGSHSFGELIAEPGMESALQQLHYYGLLSFGSNRGRLRTVPIGPEYRAKYSGGDFVIFPMVPITVELYTTDICNFSCIHCAKDASPSGKPGTSGELTTEELLGIIDECGRIGVVNLQLTGGEPLTNPDFFKLVRKAKEGGIFHLMTSTNGWLVDDKIARELSHSFDNIQVSVHGASSSTHDHIVSRPGAWERARRAVRLLKEHNIKVNINFTVMRENAADVKEMPDIAREWGADSLRFLRLVPQGRSCTLGRWTEQEVAQMGSEIKRMCHDLGPDLELDAGGFPALRPVQNDATVYGCDAGKTLMSIESTGGIRSFGCLGGDYLGQVREQSLLDIWHSPPFIELRKQSDCKDCNYRSICWGPCLINY